MINALCKDIRTNTFVRVIRKINDDTYLVLKLENKHKYLVDKKDLVKVKE